MGKGKRNRNIRAATPKRVWRPTAEEHRAMLEEINKQILERDAEYWKDLDACVLWTIHRHLGFGEKRLKRLFKEFNKDHAFLRSYYAVGDDSAGNGFVARELLKRDGIDLDAWEKEEGLR